MLGEATAIETDRQPDAGDDEHHGPWSGVPTAARAPGKGKVRLLSVEDLDGRTKAAQHCAATRNAIMADLGGSDALSTLERLLVDNVAVLDAVARDMGLRWLAGEKVDSGEFCAVVNTLRRAGGSLGWRRRAKDVTSELTKRLREIDGGPHGA